MTQTAARTPFWRSLWFLVLVATAAGIAVGALWPAAGAAAKPLGDAFIALVRMIIAPVIFLTVVHGVASVPSAGAVGRIAGKALVYFLAITALALLMGLVAVNLTQPGAGMNIAAGSLDPKPIAAYVAQAHKQNVPDMLLDAIPETFVSAFTKGVVLQVVLVSLLTAFSLSSMGEAGKPILNALEGMRGVVFKIVGILMWAAPAGAFGAMAFTVAKFGLASLWPLLRLIGEFYALCAVFVAVVLGGVAWAAGVNLWRLMGYLKDEIAIVAATTSTETVLPRLVEKLTALGCKEEVVGLVLPTGYAFNLDGTCLYLATATMFLAQATNTPMTLTEQLAMMGVLLLTSKGAAAVPGAAFIVLAATLSQFGTIPVVSIVLVLGIHRLLAEAMTFVNLMGNALAVIVVARWEGAVDRETLAARVG